MLALVARTIFERLNLVSVICDWKRRYMWHSRGFAGALEAMMLEDGDRKEGQQDDYEIPHIPIILASVHLCSIDLASTFQWKGGRSPEPLTLWNNETDVGGR